MKGGRASCALMGVTRRRDVSQVSVTLVLTVAVENTTCGCEDDVLNTPWKLPFYVAQFHQFMTEQMVYGIIKTVIDLACS